MKKHITVEQAKEFEYVQLVDLLFDKNDDRNSKFKKWFELSEEEGKFENYQWMAMQFTIDKMIEIIIENKEQPHQLTIYSPVGLFSNYEVKFSCCKMFPYVYKSAELCDALFEAVKEVPK